MENIKITLETLYDIFRNEKKREDLQKLEDTFFLDIVSYLKEKKTLLESQQDSDDLFAAGEKDKSEYELRSIKRILKEIYEKREKKIIDIAVNKSRTGSDIIDTSCMLNEEKQFYEQMLLTLDHYRKGILLQLFRGDLPIMSEISKEDTFSQFEEDSEEEPEIEDKPTIENEENKEETNLTSVRFINPMPSFVWKDMKVYGPYDKGEEIEIFPEVADLLVRKGRVEKI